jgi:succinate dehydrogenase / fumarate reductase iron-sulfur subunit
MQRRVVLRILRFVRGMIDPPRFQEFALMADDTMSILDCLERIRQDEDSTLMYRHSCHHSSCGTCACKINSRERLACTTRVADLEHTLITLEPLDGFPVLGDLVVDMNAFYRDIAEEWGHLRQSENVRSTRLPQGIDRFLRFENCIECGACVSACPVMHQGTAFLGPAVLAAINNEMVKSPDRVPALERLAGDTRGVRVCEQILACSRVCPTKVYPAKHIADLRKRLYRGNAP